MYIYICIFTYIYNIYICIGLTRLELDDIKVPGEEGAELYALVDPEDGEHHVERLLAHLLACTQKTDLRSAVVM